MTRKICILNYKGGTGKTTTVVNLAAALAKKGKKTLIVDTDPQGATSYHLGVNAKYTLYDLLFKTKNYVDVILEARENLDIIASSERLFPAELAMSKINKREFILRSLLKKIDHQYDFILIDCGPSLNLLNQNALLYANEIIIPAPLEYLSLLGIKQLLNNIKLLSSTFKHNLEISAIVPTFYDKRKKKSAEILNSIESIFPETPICPIRVSSALADAIGFQQSIFEFSPNSPGALDYTILAEEVINNNE